jgi:AAA family ATP:ADP antiporter
MRGDASKQDLWQPVESLESRFACRHSINNMRSISDYCGDTLAFLQRMLSRIVDVKPHETAAMLSAFAYFFCLLCSYYLLRPLRDAMGLAGGVGNLQWLFTATFVAMLVLVPVFGAVATRWPPRRFVPYVYRFFAVNVLIFGALFAAGIAEVAVSRVFFVWISVFNLFVISIFWSVIADNFKSGQGRRLFGFIAAGGTAGALIGPALAASLVVKFGVVVLTVIAAVLLEMAVQFYRCLVRARPNHDRSLNREADTNPLVHQGARSEHGSSIGGGIFSGITLIMRNRYLLGIVLYMLLHTFASTFLYFEQARIVAATLADTASRTQLFAIVDLAVSCLTIALQIFVTGRFISRFGVVAALILLPVVGMLAVAGIAIWPALVTLIAAQGFRRSIDYAIVRPGREILFTVVSREAKYKAKNVIETVVYRGGDAVSGWIFAALSAVGIGFSGIAVIFVPLTAIWIALAAWLGRKQEQQATRSSADTDAEVQNAGFKKGASNETGVA